MRQRRSSNASLSPAYRPSPPPPALSSPYSQPQVLLHPRPTSSLRNSIVPPPASKKRSHELDSPVTASSSADPTSGTKRSKLDFDTFQDEEESSPAEVSMMQLDDQEEEELPKSSISTNRGKKRSQLSSGSSSDRENGDEFERDGERDQRSELKRRRSTKKAKKDAIGAGSVRDKRTIDDVNESDVENMSAHEDADPARGGESRNADSEVESEGEEAEPVERQQAKEVTTTHRNVAKRFREKFKREGSEDQDLMGDDDLLSPPPPARAVKRVNATPSSSKKTLSSRSTRKLKPSTPAKGHARPTPRKRSSSSSRGGASLASEAPEEHEIGQVWQNHEGDLYRLDAPPVPGQSPVQRRLVECRERRLKYRLPKDVRHPDSNETHEVVVERWVTQEEYRALFEQRKLAWQLTFEEEEAEKERERKRQEAADAPPESGDQSMEDLTSALVKLPFFPSPATLLLTLSPTIS